jgi:adenylate cyclase
MCQNTLLQILLNEQKIGYVIANANLSILHYGGNVAVFSFLQTLDSSLSLLDLIPELSGCEDLLQDILEGTLPRFQLENLNLISLNQEMGYVNITILPYFPEHKQGNGQDEPWLLIILADTSAWTHTQQMLTQQRNELRLLKQKLDDTNQRLEFIRQRYVPREVGDALMERRIVPQLGGEVREVTVLFADLRNYTSVSEKLTPDEMIKILHVCLDIAASAIMEAGGVVVNYMGDAVMAIFNAPNPQIDHAYYAVQAALVMQMMACLYHQQADWEEAPLLHFGVGINTGPALVGNIGAQFQYQYSAIGDTINVASRICSHAKPGEVLIGANTYAHLQHQVTAQPLPPIKFKGKSQALTVYRVETLNSDPLLETIAKYVPRVPL